MSREVADAMNNMTLAELQGLYVQGFVAVIGNGQLCAVVPADKVEQAERQRTKEGY